MRTAIILTVLSILTSASSASGALQVCNESPFRLSVAVGYYESGVWKSRGWYQVDAARCESVVGGNLTNRYYYVHAVDSTGSHTWGDVSQFCTQSNAFTIVGQNCAERGFDTATFAKVDTGTASDFQFNLTCNVCTTQSGYRYAMSLPRVKHSMSVAGRSVQVSAFGALQVDFTGSDLKATADIYSDISDFQSEAGNIVRAQVNHNDDCDYILNVHTVNLSPSGSSLRVYAAAHYEDWECPVVDLGPVGEIDGGKHRLFEQNGDITAVLTPGTDGSNVWMSVDVTGLDGDGIFGVLLDTSWIGPYIRDLILRSIPDVIHIGDIRWSLPPALRSFPLRLTEIAFYDRGRGALGLHVRAEVTVSAQQAQAVWNQLR